MIQECLHNHEFSFINCPFPGAMPKIFSDDQFFLVLFQIYFWPIEGWIHALFIRNGFWQYKIFQKAKHLDQHKVFCSWLNLFWRQGNRFKFFKKLSYYNFVKDFRTELSPNTFIWKYCDCSIGRFFSSCMHNFLSQYFNIFD